MMRRLVVAILLIAAGLGVLHFAIGFENFAKVDGGPQDEPIRRTHDERGLDGGVRVGGDDDETAAISVSGSGEFRDVEREEHVLPDGSRLRLRVYELVAEDSETVADDLVRLDRVTVRFFRIETEPAPPHEVLEGSLTARQAFLQFEKDEEGEPSIREDRDMDLRDVVLESTAESRIPGLRLVVERLLVRQTEQGIDFRTPTEDVPLELTLAARDGEVTSLRGRGVRGVLPPRSDAPGAVLEIHVSSSPVFVHGGSSIRARGPLDYVEDVGSGLGELALRDDVVLEGLPGDDGEAADGHARGERLAGRLLRPRPDARSDPDRPRSSRVAWSDLVLAGDGARRVELVQGTMRLSCDRLAVHPAIDGEPAVFIAEGAPSLTDPTLPPATAPRFRAADRIHVVDVARYVGGLHRAFGDPAPWLGRLAGRLVIFEGRASDDRARP